jgi:hypothetical protein
MVCQLSKSSSAKIAAWLRYVVLVFPEMKELLLWYNEAAKSTAWPGLKLAKVRWQHCPGHLLPASVQYPFWPAGSIPSQRGNEAGYRHHLQQEQQAFCVQGHSLLGQKVGHADEGKRRAGSLSPGERARRWQVKQVGLNIIFMYLQLISQLM